MARTNTTTGGSGLTSVAHDASLLGDGTNGSPLGLAGVLTDGTTVFGDGVNTPLFAKANSNNKILSGGASWSGTGYVYDVSALTYFFDGVQYGPTTPTQITLDAADPTDDRFDAIVVDQAGTISKITGTASANPVFPAIPDDQLLVQYVNVMAGTTQPTVLQDVIYNENIEWTASQYDTTTGATGTVNVASTSSPKTGTKCVQATATNYRRGAKFVRATAIDLQQFAYVQIWFRNDSVGMPTTKNPYFQFQNSAGNPTGNNVNLLTYGVSRTIVSTWQLAVIPVSAFGAITLVKGARMIVTGGTLASTDSWSVDFMLLSGGIVPQGDIGPIFQSPSGTLYSNGAATGATANPNGIFFGILAGFNASNAANAIMFGENAGRNSNNTPNAIFLGLDAGNAAINADRSIFLGNGAGQNSDGPSNQIFIGTGAGLGDINSGAPNILMGKDTHGGGFEGVIVLGGKASGSVTATKDFQFIINPLVDTFRMRGNDWIMPATNAAGVLYQDGLGNLNWGAHIDGVPTFADDAAAGVGGLVTGDLYKTTTLGSTFLKIVP